MTNIVKNNLNKVILGNALEVLKEFPDESIDSIITSPPYYNLRDYGTPFQIFGGSSTCKHEFVIGKEKVSTKLSKEGNTALKNTKANFEKPTDGAFCTKCGAWKGELGLEPTPDLFIEHLCLIFDEIYRVLAKHGTCWVNLGDTYSSGTSLGMRERIAKERNSGTKLSKQKSRPKPKTNLQSKCLIGIPARFQIAMINRGWILRNIIIWHKPNAMPSSVKDRFTIDYEYVFFFSKNQKYFFEQQHETITNTTLTRANGNFISNVKTSQFAGLSNTQQRKWYDKLLSGEVKGRNMRTVWTIPTKNSSEDHFALFPDTLVERMIKAGCPKEVCKECGKPKVAIIERTKMPDWDKENKHSKKSNYGKTSALRVGGKGYNKWKAENPDKIVGFSECKCNASFRKGLVLDPFAGLGTTITAAKKLGRKGIGIELQKEYCERANQKLAGFKIPAKAEDHKTLDNFLGVESES